MATDAEQSAAAGDCSENGIATRTITRFHEREGEPSNSATRYFFA